MRAAMWLTPRIDLRGMSSPFFKENTAPLEIAGEIGNYIKIDTDFS